MSTEEPPTADGDARERPALTQPLKLLDLFAGIGGFSYAAEHLVGGFITTQFVEIEPFCQNVLKKHWPKVTIHDDIRSYTAPEGAFDVICGGFPCQDISIAGTQAGLQGERSGLFYEVMRLVREIRPKYILLENVGNLLSHGNGSTFQEILWCIAKAGYDAEWACIPASDVGACHQRKRIWIIAYSTQLHSYVQGSNVTVNSESWFSESGNCHVQTITWQRGSLGQELNPYYRTYVSKPVVRRGDDGFSGRVDRLKALGNAVVPQVAAVPLQRILELAA